VDEDEDSEIILGALVASGGYNFRRFWVDARSSHFVGRVLSGALLQEEAFDRTFRMSRNSFRILHGLLGTYLF
jgi:hypothetical protein